MGHYNSIDLEIMNMAHSLRDPYGFSEETVDYIAGELQISLDEVREVLHNEADHDTV
jgi:energy-converting hydrogenase A subunit M